ncbi:hypothetical protein [Pseudomonas oryzihabitans]|uniref:Uncharacterized protein n=1 Tax=Pseudomonas oryzihabitans TaxID=47885 RepID=A0A1G5M153_9PSED|nr:hypothetical protein [Pseudomonas psychrotolerans]NMY88955.1 hypothetical protein [Pseudomonas psychrotolerans]SCZ18883.1 hypothetical protein SAMN05216279_1016 [Pseudomonas psychrotolerans]
MNTANHPADYLDTMQAAALTYLRRHECEHLGHSQALLNCAAEHLQLMGVPQHTAERLVARANNQLEALKGHRFLDIDSSTGDIGVLVNPATGLRYRIPVQEIFDALIDEDPGTQRATR